MPNVKLTNDFVETSLTCPEGKRRVEYCDASRSGLYVEVRATSPGQGTYDLRYAADGYVILRHPETDVVRDGLRRIVQILQVELGA